jgi:glutamate/tyrosine decarboxylase-like PLP-dependent enzyme
VQLAAARARGARPFFINATAGTTVKGAFDPFAALAVVAREAGCWLHVDACWGGAVALSARHRHLLDGIAEVGVPRAQATPWSPLTHGAARAVQADSIAWNPHKMVGMPLQASVLLVRQPTEASRLMQSNGPAAPWPAPWRATAPTLRSRRSPQR